MVNVHAEFRKQIKSDSFSLLVFEKMKVPSFEATETFMQLLFEL